MSRTKLILAGLLAGAVAFGTACRSDSAAERGEEPTQTPSENQGGTTSGSTTPGDTGGSGTQESSSDIEEGYSVPQEDRAGTGGTGYEEPVTHPDSSDTSGSKGEPDAQGKSPQNQE